MNNEKARKERLRSYGMGRWPLWSLDVCTVGSDGILWQFTTQTTHSWLLADVPLFPTDDCPATVNCGNSFTSPCPNWRCPNCYLPQFGGGFHNRR